MNTLFFVVTILVGITFLSLFLGALAGGGSNQPEDISRTIRRGFGILILLVLAWLAWQYLQVNPDILESLEEIPTDSY